MTKERTYLIRNIKENVDIVYSQSYNQAVKELLGFLRRTSSDPLHYGIYEVVMRDGKKSYELVQEI